jgi:hypothetical protein
VGSRIGSAALVVAVCALLAQGGCSSRGTDEVRAEAVRFQTALGRSDARAACDQLVPDTRKKLEQDEGRPCERAILELELPRGGSPGATSVEVTSAAVALTSGATTFLDDGPRGWRVSAAGCTPAGRDMPYECELEN